MMRTGLTELGLEVQNLQKVYKSYDGNDPVVALRNLNLQVKKGSFFGLLGPNGVGKSTIFQIINGLQDPTYGKVLINDTDCTNLPVYERATKFKLSMCPQYGGFFYELSVLENLQTVAEIHIQEKKDRQRKIDKIIAQFSLDSILRTAMSDNGSVPRTFALYSFSPSTLTKMSSAPWITWLFVITIPSTSIINPEPRALAFLSFGVPNSLNKSSNGEPGGNSKGKGFVLVVTIVCVVDIFTTDGINFSAKSAKEAGKSLL